MTNLRRLLLRADKDVVNIYTGVSGENEDDNLGNVLRLHELEWFSL